MYLSGCVKSLSPLQFSLKIVEHKIGKWASNNGKKNLLTSRIPNELNFSFSCNYMDFGFGFENFQSSIIS